jgi:hypothetical protein
VLFVIVPFVLAKLEQNDDEQHNYLSSLFDAIEEDVDGVVIIFLAAEKKRKRRQQHYCHQIEEK